MLGGCGLRICWANYVPSSSITNVRIPFTILPIIPFVTSTYMLFYLASRRNAGCTQYVCKGVLRGPTFQWPTS